jgi:hypothetical protein
MCRPSLFYGLHGCVGAIARCAASSPRVPGNLIRCPGAATTRHLMRISFGARCWFMLEAGYSPRFPRAFFGLRGHMCSHAQRAQRRVGGVPAGSRLSEYSTVYHTTVPVRLRRAVDLLVVSRPNFGHFWGPNRRSGVLPPKFWHRRTRSVFTPRFLDRRFHVSIAVWEGRNCRVRAPIETDEVSLESYRKVRVPQACGFRVLPVFARREILLALTRCRTFGFIRETFGPNGGRLGPRN